MFLRTLDEGSTRKCAPASHLVTACLSKNISNDEDINTFYHKIEIISILWLFVESLVIKMEPAVYNLPAVWRIKSAICV